MVELIANIFADGPQFDPYNPDKRKVRDWGTRVEGIITAFVNTGGTIFFFKTTMDGFLTPAINSIAWVLGDPVVENNGIYKKLGASGTGSWQRMGDLPYSFIIANDAGAGTPNAIVATTSIPVSGSALVWIQVADTNTGSPVTVSFNGGPALVVKSNSGNDVAVGGLVAGMTIMGIVSGLTFRLVSDQASAAIVAAAEAAKDAAEAAQIAAEAAQAAAQAAANSQYRFATEAAFVGATIPVVISFIETAGYYESGDGGGHTKKRIAAPSVVKPWQKQSADGAWWQICPGKAVFAEMFGARGDYDEDTATGTDNAAAINAALSFYPQVALRGGFYQHGATITLERHHKLYTAAAGYSNSVLDADYFDAPLCHSILVPRGLARVHVIEPMITECANSGGVLANQNAGELYTTSSGTRLNTYRIMDLTNKNAVGATQATQRAVSIAVLAKAGSELDRVSIRPTSMSGKLTLDASETNWGDQVDFGYMGENGFFAAIRKSVIAGPFRDAAIALIPQDVVGDSPDYYPQSDRLHLDECFVEGHCSWAIRGADELLVTGVATTYIECAWFRSHRFATSGSITAGGVAYTYTSLTFVGGTTLRFGGLALNPVSNGLTVGAVMTRTQDARTYGTGGISASDCFFRSISHPSLRLSTDSFFTDAFDKSGRVFEFSGIGVRGIHLQNCYMHGREDILGWILNAQDIHFNTGWWETKSRNTPAGSGLDSSRLIALSTLELNARGIAGAVPSCAQNIKLTGWTGTGGTVDRRPAMKQSGSASGVFGNTVSDDAGYFQPGRGYDDAYSGPSSGPSGYATLVQRVARLRGTQHRYTMLSPSGSVRASLDAGDRWAFGFGWDTAVDLPYALNLMFGGSTVMNANNTSNTNTAGYRAQNLAGSASFTVASDGSAAISVADVATLRVFGAVVRPAADNAVSLGSGSFRWSQLFAATATINTSDENFKAYIESINELILEAWADVSWVQFKMKDAVAEKGANKARLHFGLIAQRVRDVFAAHGLDPYSLGLLCYDAWDETTEDVFEEYDAEIVGVDAEGNEVVDVVKQTRATGETIVVRAAGSAFGLRYEECFALEAAYMRRRVDQLQAALN